MPEYKVLWCEERTSPLSAQLASDSIVFGRTNNVRIDPGWRGASYPLDMSTHQILFAKELTVWERARFQGIFNFDRTHFARKNLAPEKFGVEPSGME